MLLLLAACLPWVAPAQTINLVSGVQKYASLTSTTVNLSGKCELWVTSASAPLSGCTINLNSADAWLFLPGVKPSTVASTYLGQVRVSGAAAVADSNVRVVQYGQGGAIVIPHAASFQPLTVFSEPEFGGTATSYGQWTYYTGSGLGSFSSFKLKRGYQAVLAQSSDGKNYSKCYVAQDGDLEVGVLPPTLDKQVRFLYVTPWRWTSKKGIAGDPGIGLLNLLWWYNWNANANSSRDLEYVAIRQNQSWPGLSQNWQTLGVNTLLGYNEPDNPSQANLSVSTAIGAWGDLLATGLRVGSPATTDGGRYNWLYPFVQQADAAGLRVDFVAVHYYWAWNPADPNGAANQMYNFLLDIWNNTHRPIWITEWNNGANWTDNNPYPLPTYAQQQACIAAMVQMLENTPFVERYALYNWVEDVRSVVTNGVATPAGVAYSNQVSGLAYLQTMPDNGTRSLAQYLFETNTLDTSGYCNNALVAGAPAYTNGHSGKAVVLDGANTYLQLPANIACSNAFSFAAWVYWNGGSDWQRIFDFGNGTAQYLLLTPSSGSGTLRFAITANSYSNEQRVETSRLPTGQWQHVCVTLGGGVARLYTNGVLAASASGVTLSPASFTPRFNYLGKSQFASDPLLNGYLDTVQIADYAFTAAQVAALLTNTPASTPAFSSGTWSADANGSWGNAGNWSAGVVANGGNGLNYSADFSTLNISADRTVTLDAPRAIGGLKFGDLSGAQNWTLASGANSLTLDTGSLAVPTLIVRQNTATLAVPLLGTNGFAKSGAGTLVLAGASSPTGTLYIDTASTTAAEGIVRAANPGALAGVTSLQIRNNSSGSSTLQLDGSGGGVISPAAVWLSGRNNSVPAIENVAGSNLITGGLTLNSGGAYYWIQSDAGVLSWGGPLSSAASGTRTLVFLGKGDHNVAAPICDGNATLNLSKTGSGTLTLCGQHSYSGATYVNQGTLRLQASTVNVLPSKTTLSVAAGATWDLGGVSQTIASLTGSGSVTNSGGPATLVLSNSAGSATFDGGIADLGAGNALSVTASGAATSILSGVNSYHGTTVVNGGTLLVNGSLGSGAVSVAGGTLGGTGIIGAALTVQAGGTLAPGTGAATLTANGSVTLQPGSTTCLEIDKSALTNDQLQVTGLLTCGGTLVVTNLAGTLAAGDTFQLFSAGSVAGAFAATNLPPLACGLSWNFNAASGLLSVLPATTPANISCTGSGGTLTLSWPADHLGWRLLVQTNHLALGLSQDPMDWGTVAISQQTNQVVLPLDSSLPAEFYRLVYP